ncbi:MAG: hypothetical protein ACLFQM_09600 [Fidelibacterota bacterium]
MINILKIIGWGSLLLLVLPSFLFLSGAMELKQVHSIMAIATIIWFVISITVVFLQRKEKQ